MPKIKKSKLIRAEEHKEEGGAFESDQSIHKEEKEALGEKGSLKDIANDIIASYETRVRVVGGIIDDTHKMIDDFRGKRETMAKELQEILAKCESLRKKDFDRMMADIVARQNEREKQVKEMLENFRREEETVAEKLKKLLTKGEEIRIKDFKKMMVDIRQEQEGRAKETGESIAGQLQDMRQEVHTMLDNFKKERRSVAKAWYEMLGLFHQEKALANPEAEQVRYGAGPGNPGGDAKEKEDIKNNDNNK